MTGKAPAMMFYVADYMQDTRMVSLAARGAWMDLLCAMWRSTERGELTSTYLGFSRLFGCSPDQAKSAIRELIEAEVCDVVTESDGKVTLRNRRMFGEANERKQANLRQQRYRSRHSDGAGDAASDGQGDGNVTDPSSYSVSNSSSKQSTTADKPPPLFLIVFEYWKAMMKHPEAQPTVERRRYVMARIKEGYTVEQIKRAVDGCKASPHHQGQTNGTVYDDLTLICRSGSKLESFINIAALSAESKSSGRDISRCPECKGRGVLPAGEGKTGYVKCGHHGLNHAAS